MRKEPLIDWRRDGWTLFGIVSLMAGLVVSQAWTSWVGRIVALLLIAASFLLPWRYGPER